MRFCFRSNLILRMHLSTSLIVHILPFGNTVSPTLQAARKLAGTYLDTAAALFLPRLRQGLGSHNYRVRYASVALLGEVLERLTNGEPITIPELNEEVPPDA